MDTVSVSSDCESDSTPRSPVERDFAFCIVVGGGQVGTMITNQLLDLGWPAQLIQMAVNDKAQVHIKELENRGVKCTLAEEVYKEKLGRAVVVLLAIRPSNLEQFTRTASKHMPKNALLVSCLSGVPVKKIKASLNSGHVIRTLMSPSQLPLDKVLNFSPEEEINAAMLHAIANTEDANNSLDVLADLFRKRRIGEDLIPKRVATAPEFMRTIVKKVIQDRDRLFGHLIPELAGSQY